MKIIDRSKFIELMAIELGIPEISTRQELLSRVAQDFGADAVADIQRRIPTDQNEFTRIEAMNTRWRCAVRKIMSEDGESLIDPNPKWYQEVPLC